ncbi:outer membrane lipoprotein chaperone LolA [Alteromonas aestuariivivens]|nr:outer membrane lipoprotein chaperone LolA [Alteromonas aestuariivivens]
MQKFFMASLSLLAVSANSLADDPKAKAELQSKLAAMQQYQAEFAQAVVDVDGELIHEATGKLTMAQPDKLRWETFSPDETLLVADGTSVWNLDPFVEQVTVINQQTAVQDNPIILLTTADMSVWNQFDIEYGLPGKHSFVVKPLDGEGQIKSLSLTFQGDVLSSLAMTDAQSQVSTLKFASVESEFVLPDSTFRVSIPDTYVVDDQR